MAAGQARIPRLHPGFFQFSDDPALSGRGSAGAAKFVRACGLVVALIAGLSPGAVAAAEFNLHAALGAPENLVISGSMRARIEAIDGQFRPIAAQDDAMLSMQTTLFVEYRPGPVRLGAELFDARGYFQKPLSSAGTGEVNALEMAQLYVGLDLGETLGAGSLGTLTAGRFTMNIGSRRLIARNAFRNSVNAFTGLRLDWTGAGQAGGGRDRATVFWAMPHLRLPRDPRSIRRNEVEFDRESTDLQLLGASYTRAGILGGSLEIYAYGLLERDAPGFPTTNRRLFTPGIRLFRAAAEGRFDHDLEVIHQFGTARETILAVDDLDVSAWFVHAEVGRSLGGPWHPRVAVQFDFASGDGDDPRTLNRFDTLSGARRFEYGPSGLFGPVGRANLMSPALRLEIAPDPRWDAFVGWRPLWLASATDSFSATNIRDRSGASGRFAGHLAEARGRYWLLPRRVWLDVGVALLAKGRFLRDAPLARDNGDTRYGYVDIGYSF